MSHTPEPWAIQSEFYHKRNRMYLAGSGVYGEAHYIMPVSADAVDNARRIVACVNACKGIPTEELEALPPGKLLGIYQEARK